MARPAPARRGAAREARQGPRAPRAAWACVAAAAAAALPRVDGSRAVRGARVAVSAAEESPPSTSGWLGVDGWRSLATRAAEAPVLQGPSASGRAVASVSADDRPPLRLSFDVEATLAVRSPPEAAAVLDVARVVSARSRLAVARDEPPAPGHSGGFGNLADLRRSINTQVFPFFNESVCFSFDAPGVPGLLDKLGDDVADQALASAAGKALGVPLDMYERADRFAGWRAVDGGTCGAWEVQDQASMPASVLVDDGPAEEQRAVLLRAMALARAPPRWGEAGLAAGKNASDQKEDTGVFNFEVNASFCVDQTGRLLAVNTSSWVELKRNGTDDARVAATKQAVLKHLEDPRLEARLFHPERQSPSGQCADLTGGAANSTQLVNERERIALINREAGGGWVAAPYGHWRGLSLADLSSTLGATMEPLRLPLRPAGGGCVPGAGGDCSFKAGSRQPPPSFDARERWSECPSIRAIRNQGKCGSCWAFSAATVLADRFCVASLGSGGSMAERRILSNLVLSPQYMVDCDGVDAGCGGGHLDDAWEFLRTTGASQEQCDPYLFCLNETDALCGMSRGNATGMVLASSGKDRCGAQCVGGHPRRTFRASSAYAVSAPGDAPSMQMEILQHGPIQVGFFVFSDWMSYRNGTYFRTASAFGPMGAHAVRLIGWGTDARSTPFWLVANSYGAGWGESGLFRIRRGSNECGIETTPAAGLPELPGRSEAAAPAGAGGGGEERGAPSGRP